MTGNLDDHALVDLAACVSDGNLPDAIEGEATEQIVRDPAVLQELQVLARIAEVHRSPARAKPEQRRDYASQQWGHLEVKERLGSGSFGSVYRARDPRLQRDVALKIYRTEGIPDARLTSLFAEGRLLARVRHPNVAVVHGVEQYGDEVGLWLELVDGRTLADEVRQSGPLGFREAALVGVELCRALAAVHQAGIVHGDVKPQNVMRERGGRIVLMDFGIGRDLAAEREHAWQSGGTPLYMAPELFAGTRPAGVTDIYSLGVLLFFLVTGTHPVVAGSRADLEQSHRDGRRRLLRDVRSDLPDAFVDVIDRACASDPAQRYASAGALQSALTAAMGLFSGASAAGSAAVRPRRAIRSTWIASAAALLLAGAGGFVAYRASTTGTPPPVVDQTPQSQGANGTAGSDIDPSQYRIRAVFRRAIGAGSEVLQAGSRVKPGDRLFLDIDATTPVHVYVVNQDERGESYLLFPLPGQAVKNPLPAGKTHRLPHEVYWEVTSAGGREHFLIVASPEPLGALEAVFARLPAPQVGGPAPQAAALSQEEMGHLRGIGGLAPRKPQGQSSDLFRSAVVLGTEVESVKGPWIRQLTLENPAR